MNKTIKLKIDFRFEDNKKRAEKTINSALETKQYEIVNVKGDEYEIMLVHMTKFPPSKLLGSFYNNCLIIAFSGGNQILQMVKKEDLDSKRVLVINRPVMLEGISQNEWQRIYDLIETDSDGKPIGFLNHSLKPTIFETTAALSILCQGYLVAHQVYNGDKKNWKDEDINDAIEKMGWNKCDGNIRNVITIDDEKLDIIKNVNYWKDIFQNNADGIKNLIREENANIDLAAIEELIENIYETEVKPEKVGKAYCRLHEILVGKQ